MIELFIPTTFDELTTLEEQEKLNRVKLHILLFHVGNDYFCSEFKRVEDMIADGYTIKAIKDYINDGLIRIISVFPEGKEK